MKLASLLIGVVLYAGVAEANEHAAERFDLRASILSDGSLRVVETIVFRFEEGTFTQLFREIPTRRTDGVEILTAEMDGRPFPFGTGANAAEVRRRQRLRVTWRFPAVSTSTHTFTLTYLIRGAVRQETDADRLDWRALPSEHAYRIRASTVQIDLPAPLAAEPSVQTRRTGDANVSRSETGVVISAHTIRSNGWIEASLRFPRGSVTSSPPLWQQRETRQRHLAPRWLAAAGMIVFASMVLFFGIHQGYDPPPGDASVSASGAGVPDQLPAPIAGALVSHGPNQLHAMATLLVLADRGEIRIAELPPGMFGQRSFTIERTPSGRPLSRSEEAALNTIFGKKQDPQVTLAKARSRLMHGMKHYNAALKEEMNAAGLLDANRERVRQRYVTIGIALLVAGGLGFIPAGFLMQQFGAWAMAVPGAFLVAGVIGLIFYAALTPLSNDAVRRAHSWRGFQKHLKAIASDRAAAPREAASQLLPFAVALGLGPAWSKYLKKYPSSVPRWFHALSSEDASHSFVLFIAAGAATGHGGGAGGAAGGA